MELGRTEEICNLSKGKKVSLMPVCISRTYNLLHRKVMKGYKIFVAKKLKVVAV